MYNDTSTPSWVNPSGGNTDQQKIQFLYNLAAANPKNSSLANQYLDAYMNYQFPQPNIYEQMAGLMGGNTATTSGYTGDPNTDSYIADIENRLGRKQASMVGGNVGLGSDGGQGYYIPDEEYQAFINAIGQQQPQQSTLEKYGPYALGGPITPVVLAGQGFVDTAQKAWNNPYINQEIKPFIGNLGEDLTSSLKSRLSSLFNR